MGLLDELEDIRKESLRVKREHIEALIKESVRNRSFISYYGYSSDEDFEETEEILEDIADEICDSYSLEWEQQKGKETKIIYNQREVAVFPNRIKLILERY